MRGWIGRTAALSAASIMAGIAATGASGTPEPQGTPAVTVERVVLLMRHGVRPPTKNPPMPAGTAADPWPAWDVPPGYLTESGAKAVTLLGGFDRRVLAAGLVGTGCPAPGSVRVYSDSDQRTIATGDAWIAGFAPGCTIAHDHKPENTPDALFDPIELGGIRYDPARADAAVKAHLGAGGIPAIEARQREGLALLDRIYCGATPPEGCGFSNKPSALRPAKRHKEPKLSGGLDRGSTAGQILLLEYADNKPMAQVGWGRASAADIEAAGAFHALEYGVIARVPYLAAASGYSIVTRMATALISPAGQAPKLDLIVGHDGNIAALAGILDLHWKVGGFAGDDPSPGGAIGLELVRANDGRRYVRAFYRSQTLDQIRHLAPLDDGAPVQMMTISACTGATADLGCPLEQFTALVDKRLSPVAP